MKRYTLYLLFVLISTAVSAQSLEQKAEAAYTAEKYEEAIALYAQMLDQGMVSSDLYYNLGNSFYRIGNLGNAVLNYERALLFDPNHENARVNLSFVKSRLTDKFVEDENIVDVFWHKFMSITTSDGWAVIGLVCFFLLLGAVALYIFNDNVLLRKVGFFGGAAFLVVCAAANIVAFKSADQIRNSNAAIVTVDASVLSSSPRDPKSKAEEAFILHEGTKVHLLDSVDVKNGSQTIRWFDVQADATHRAWIKETDITKI